VDLSLKGEDLFPPRRIFKQNDLTKTRIGEGLQDREALIPEAKRKLIENMK